MYLRAIGRGFTQMIAYFLVMNSKRCKVCEAAPVYILVLGPQRTQRVTGNACRISLQPDWQIDNSFFDKEIMARNEILVTSVCETEPKSVFLAPPVYHCEELSTRDDWPVKKTTVNLPIRLKGNSKRTPGNSLNPLGAQNKDIGTGSQMLLTEVKLCLRRKLPYSVCQTENNGLFYNS